MLLGQPVYCTCVLYVQVPCYDVCGYLPYISKGQGVLLTPPPPGGGLLLTSCCAFAACACFCQVTSCVLLSVCVCILILLGLE
jgi:hypothetical protein